MWRILIVDDQAIVRQGLKVMLEQDEKMKVTHEAENGKEAIDILERNHLVDLILMDVRMPVMNGMEATRIMKKKWPEIKILILTTFNDEQYALETLKDGASGFLLKTADSEKLIKAVYSTMNDGLPIHEEVAAKVIPNLLQRDEVKTAEIPAELTEREIAIIKLVGEGKTNKEIAQILYLSIGTVKNHLTNILQKLDCRDRTQLAIFAVKHHIS
ncbi:response regulator [Pseudogracilibacillus auburnensis]|uniref:LuxR family two component transcriptional regulator n=1 Tax=Pseudogracilibacillus auburnensis TaxID=1494959 RepID=A0A2V3VY53_9BACI|nr:response regulator transcription factor [Pseudogracilibacillus auburnensis]MBO1005361.1 response regulator transcription factor [Pseudogracilibacillus auburnensis]PXW86963.1 LuxR family two component transcriptional regulator [Pseudogracilibacillus auburnensis]